MSKRIRPATRWALLVAIAALAASLVVAACGSSSNSSSASSSSSGSSGGAASSGGSSSGGGKKLGLMMDVFRNDKGFGTATFAGAQQAAKAFGLQLSVVDGLGNKPQQAVSALNNLVRDNDYVVDGASATNGILPRVAGRNPSKQFSVYAVPVAGASNLHYAFQDWYPLGYIAGVVAAKSTKTGTIGFVGGGQIPPTIRGREGYIAGAKATKPGIKILNTITGDFDDAVKGQNATSAQIAQNADVIYSFLDAAHAGAVHAVKQSGKQVKLMGVIIPKCSFSQGFELGDTVANQSQLVFDLVKGMINKSLQNTVFGVQDPKVASFQFCPGKSSSGLKAAVTQTLQKFNSGQLKSPKE